MIFLTALAALLAGCTPPAARALREGRRLLDAGQYEKAVPQLQLATRLASTNDAAWNYLGVACHRAGQFTNAVAAYQQAIRLNRDLMEARYNLGCLWFDLKRFDQARDAFTSCTVMRPGYAEAWLRRGSVELRLREFANAESSFREVLKTDAQNPEALNGLGLALLQRNHPHEAAQQFALALKARPDFAPALLNLATVSQQHLNDRAAALQYYRQYLALNPRPPEYDAVQKMVQSLEPPVAAASAPTPRVVVQTPPATSAPAPRIAASNPVVPTTPPPAVVALPAVSKIQTNADRRAVAATVPTNAPITPAKPPRPSPAVTPGGVEVVKLPPEPVIKGADQATEGVAPALIASEKPLPAAESPTTAKSGHKSILARINPANLFRSDSQPAAKATPSPAGETPVVHSAATPIPADTAASGSNWPRYNYLPPGPLLAGDRAAAEKALAKARSLAGANRSREAWPYFQQAAQTDPSWFDARFALGLAALQAGDYRAALPAWEHALMIDPKSLEARYNFALALKAANYPIDAVAQLEQVVVTNPDDVRAQLALGNLYAETLRDRARAKVHYSKVLELSPQHPQSTSIRYWLLANDT